MRTWQVIKELQCFHLPSDYRRLVEEVYEEVEDNSTNLKEEYCALKKMEELARQEAELRLLPPPDPEDLFTSVPARMVFEESETKASWTVAQTRLGERSINLIPLEDHGEFCTLPGNTMQFAKDQSVSRTNQILMLRYQVRVGHQDIVDALMGLNTKTSVMFANSSLLQDVKPLWLKNGKSEINTKKGFYMVELDPELGLIINRKGG
jgi:hypothetical protein